jgi:uncharacterized membrane protein
MKIKPYVVIPVGVVLIVLIVLASPAIKRQLNDWKLLPEPERLTELYFTHPNSLPSSYMPGQTQTVSFTVHNLEYRTTTYKYTVVEAAQAGQAGTTLASGRFTLNQGSYKKVTDLVAIQPSGARVNVEVDRLFVN